MAHSLSAKKRVRQNLKHRARNRARKGNVRDLVKTFNADLLKNDTAKAETDLRKTVQMLDRVASKGAIHKNTAARKRSRLTRKLNKLKAGAGTPAAKA